MPRDETSGPKASGRPRVYESAAQRQAAYRQRKAQHIKQAVTVLWVALSYTLKQATVLGVFSSLEAAQQALEPRRAALMTSTLPEFWEVWQALKDVPGAVFLKHQIHYFEVRPFELDILTGLRNLS